MLALFVARASDVHEQRKPWVPLILEASYRPKGWLGIMLGSRLYYEFTDAVLSNAEDWKRIADSVAQEVRRHGGAQAVAEARPQEAVAVAAAAAAPAVPMAIVSPPMREAAAGVSVSSATTNTSIFNTNNSTNTSNASATNNGNTVTSIVLL